MFKLKRTDSLKDKFKKFWKRKVTKNKNRFSMKELLLFMLITLVLGIFIGGLVMYKFGMLGSNASLYEFAATYNEILDSYYEDVDADKLLQAGISGMVGYLGDPYTTYMNKDSADAFNEDVEGYYYGVGAEVKYDEKFEKVSIGKIFENSPAEKAGLKTDDILIKVNGEDIKGKTLAYIAEKVKGPDGTDVTLTILREEKEKEIKITRGPVDTISVAGEVLERDDRKIGYLAISVFASNTADQFKKELKKLEDEKIDSLIIDVRGNSGGYLTAVSEIINMFVKKDKVIYQLKTKEKLEKIKDDTDESRDYNIVILTNSGSASASELLTGAMKETYHATIVGTKTFGKGKVQKVYTLSNGAMVKYTHQEWLTPDGNYIDRKGIEPDIEIPYEYNEKVDNQLEKAIEVLLEK